MMWGMALPHTWSLDIIQSQNIPLSRIIVLCQDMALTPSIVPSPSTILNPSIILSPNTALLLGNAEIPFVRESIPGLQDLEIGATLSQPLYILRGTVSQV